MAAIYDSEDEYDETRLDEYDAANPPGGTNSEVVPPPGAHLDYTEGMPPHAGDAGGEEWGAPAPALDDGAFDSKGFDIKGFDHQLNEQTSEREVDAIAYEPPYTMSHAVPDSPGADLHGASTSSLPEEIDVNTAGLIDETMQRLACHTGVSGILITDRDGLIVRATMPLEEAAEYAGPTLQLLQRARDCASLRTDDEFQMLCVRTRKHEMLLCSEAQGAFAICVLQEPQPDGEPSWR